MSTIEMYIERQDGELARVIIEDAGAEDCWTELEAQYPVAYDLIDERMVVPGPCDCDETISDDSSLARWLAEAVMEYSRTLEDGSELAAKRSEGIATVTWTLEDGSEVRQHISLNGGDMEELVLGADPVRDGWEDGAGRMVCREVAMEDAGVSER